MIDSTNPRCLADNIRHLAGASGSQASDISALQTYDDSEIDTGKKWIDGSSIYRKVITIDSMPNKATATIPHGIENLGTVVACYGIMQRSSSSPGIPFPAGSNPALQFGVLYIYVGTTSDFSANSGIVVLEYTKSAPSSLTSSAPDDSRSIEPEEEVREEDPEAEPVIDEPIEKPVAEVKKTTRKKSTN